MKKKSKMVFGMLALAFGLVLAGCDSAALAGLVGNPVITGVTVSPVSASVAKGGTRAFTATVIGTNSPAQSVMWTVTGGGLGTAISAGGVLAVAASESATMLIVRATSTVDTSKSGMAIVTVGATAAGVTVSPKTPVVEPGGELTFTATVSGTSTSAPVIWAVSRVGGEVKLGTAFAGAKLTVAVDEPVGALTVTATSTADGTKSDTATVAVYAAGEKPTVESVAVSPVSASVAKGGEQAFTATVIGTNSPAQTVTWVVSGGKTGTTTTIADSGILSVAADETAATLLVRATSTVDTSKSGMAIVTVPGGGAFVPVMNIAGVPTNATVGTDLILNGTVEPANATNQTIAWSVAVADEGTTGASIVDGNKLRTTAEGTAMVEATIVGGGWSATMDYTKNFLITVTTVAPPFVAVTGITGVPTDATAGTDLTLSGTVAPTNATNQTIVWSVADGRTTGAYIWGNTLSTDAAGTATVRATITNGFTASSDYIEDFDIAVFVPVTNITDVPTDAIAGTDLTLSGTVAPADATNQTIVWSVANAGTTGASIVDGNKLRTTAEGTAMVSATIVGGSSATIAYTQDFIVTVAPLFPTNKTLAEQLAWISSYAANNGDYTIEIRANEAIDPTVLSYSGKTVKITLKGDATERTVSLSSIGCLFTVESGVTLTLDNNVTLQGRSDNTDSLVYVYGGTLAMKGNAKITGNTSSWLGGGVYVSGSFTMSGNAAVSGNTVVSGAFSYGGGVYVSPNSSFTMSGNATVSGNTATRTSTPTYGGGVYVGSYGSFTMSDSAAVSGNAVSDGGGGVYVGNRGSFTMSGNAAVSGNTVSAGSGGGVYVYGSSFTMSGNAAVSGNTATGTSSSANGGGVWVQSNGSGSFDVGSFTMSDNAAVSGNTVSSSSSYSYGGGVRVQDSSFTKTGGVIYGNNEGANSNTVIINGSGQTYQGAAIYADSTHLRNTTVGAGQNLSKIGTTYTGQWTTD